MWYYHDVWRVWTLCLVYYEAKNRALNNNEIFHVAAYVNKKGTIGVNSERRKTAKFRKRYANSPDTHYGIHAEVDLILKLQDIPERIHVMRCFKDGTLTMAKPCVHCQNFLRIKGVKAVRYTNWDGDWETMKL